MLRRIPGERGPVRWRFGGPFLQALPVAMVALTLACSEPMESDPPPVAAQPAVAEEEVELATMMGEIQRHGAKLGFAIEGRNLPLAEFYLHEVEEVLEGLLAIEEHDGMPIAHPAGVILKPALADLEAVLDAGGDSGDDADEVEWAAAGERYEVVIEACNRCHRATEHGFIEILPARGPAPFNQRFAAAVPEGD